MFNKEKWSNIDLIKYRDEKIAEKKEDFSIIEAMDPKLNSFPKTGNRLEGIPYSLKDNYAVSNEITSAASKIIREFKPNYTSTVHFKLMSEGAVPLFKANLDELAMGGTGFTSNYGPVYNPFNKDYMVGGSSSGSNYVVADGTVPFSIGSDTGDSVRKPSAFTGTVGYKPTWGLVSRFGLYDFAPTWDTVGWFTNEVKEAALLLDVLQGFDNKDFSSMHPTDKDYLDGIEMGTDKFKVVTIPDLGNYIIDEEILKDYKLSIEKLKEDGHEIVEVEEYNKEILSTILTVYKVISSVEAFSCNSNLTGFHFGSYFENGSNYEERMVNARTEGFGYEVKKRFLLGQEARYNESNHYLKAIKIRRLINEELNRILSMGDVLLTPAVAKRADTIDNLSKFSFDNILDNILTLFNSNGSPSLVMPVTKNQHLSTSVHFAALPFQDKKVFKIANRLEEIL